MNQHSNGQIDILSEIMNRQACVPRHANPTTERRVVKRLLNLAIRYGMAAALITAAVMTTTGCGPVDPQLKGAEPKPVKHDVTVVVEHYTEGSVCYLWAPSEGDWKDINCQTAPLKTSIVIHRKGDLCTMKYPHALKSTAVPCDDAYRTGGQ